MTDYRSPSKAAKLYNVSIQTLSRWADSGVIEFIKTPGGHRRYRFNISNKATKRNIIYARVSSLKQKDDLKRQIKFLQKKYPNHEVISDIGSGINYKRKGFKAILEALFNRNIEEVVVAYKDRFTRFGFELFKWLFRISGAKLSVSEKDKIKDDRQELAEDILSIITTFSARYYGSRKEKNKVLPKNKNLSKSRTKRVL